MSATISLFGMMGAGKTTIGGFLASRLGRRLVDTDVEVEKWVGRPIAEIAARDGWDAFRRFESAVVRELAIVPDLVLALGGGTILTDDNVADLTLSGVLVYLDADADTLVARVASGEGRPLLDGDPAARLRALQLERAPRYRAVADVTVDANGDPTVVTEAILAWLVDHPDVLTPSELEAVLP